MKKILLGTLGLLLAISIVPQNAKGTSFAPGARAAGGLVSNPCFGVAAHLRQFQECPHGEFCFNIPEVILENVAQEMEEGGEGPSRKCRVRTAEQPAEANILGIVFGRNEDGDGLLSEASVTGNIFPAEGEEGHLEIYFSFDVEDSRAFRSYNSFRYAFQGDYADAGMATYPLTFARVSTAAAQGRQPEGAQGDIPNAGPLGRQLPNGAVGDAVRALGDDARQMPNEGDRNVGPRVVPFRFGGAKLDEIVGAKKPGKKVSKVPFDLPEEMLKRFAVSPKPEAVDPNPAVDAAVGDPEASASESDGTPVADLEATEVNPNTNTLCSLNMNLVPNLSSLAYVGFAFIGMVLAGIRRRIRSGRDR